jgi:hypothetical protein
MRLEPATSGLPRSIDCPQHHQGAPQVDPDESGRPCWADALDGVPIRAFDLGEPDLPAPAATMPPADTSCPVPSIPTEDQGRFNRP